MNESNRITLKTYTHSAKCYSDLEVLFDAFKKQFNRNSKVELYYSRWGDDKFPKYGIVAYYEGDKYLDEVKFFEQKAKELED